MNTTPEDAKKMMPGIVSVELTLRLPCDDPEPTHLVPVMEGKIFRSDDNDEPQQVGIVEVQLFLVERATNEQEDFAEALDSYDDATLECGEALFDLQTLHWSEAVDELYGPAGPINGADVLFLRLVKLDEPWRGKGIGAQVVRELIATFANTGFGLVAAKPFPLQYGGWMDDQEMQRQPGFEEKRRADFAKLAGFLTGLGFRQLPASDFYTFNPACTEEGQPSVPHPRARPTRYGSRRSHGRT
jgi:GNAT superfamily N-acetyltransferase